MKQIGLGLGLLFLIGCGVHKKTEKSKIQQQNKKEVKKYYRKLETPKQESFTPTGYINTYKTLAIMEMKRTGIPASITLAQGMLESNFGRSYLARKGKNHFGIKCKSHWKGKKLYVDDDKEDECFRGYDNVIESYRDHSDFLSNSFRYDPLFELPQTDYKGWAKGLKKQGYATNPKYAHLLIKLIKRYNLNRFDKYYATTYYPDKQQPLMTNSKEEPKMELVGKSARIHIEEEKNPPTENRQKEKTSNKKSRIIYKNDIPAVVTHEGDTYLSIASGQNMLVWELLRYNDLPKNAKLYPGTLLYLKPKHNRTHKHHHQVQQGEIMYWISQKYGIKLDHLYDRNNMESGEEPAYGEIIYLRNQRSDKPSIRVKHEPGYYAQIPPYGGGKTKSKQSTSGTPAGKNSQPESREAKNNRGNQQKSTTKHENTRAKKKYHIVEAGETLFQISKKYDIIINHLRKWNELDGYDLNAGQKLWLVKPPQSSETTGNNTTKNTSREPANVHWVNEGETLQSIAKQYDLTAKKIMKWNHLEDQNIEAGQKLYLSKPDDSRKFHVVQPGETLYSISINTGVSVKNLREFNRLDEDKIKIGQKLYLEK